MNKSLLRIDVMIDDHLSNLTSNICERICLDYPWNRSASKDYVYDIKRAYSWNDVVDIINKIEKEMKEWEKK
jgi:5'(3')-deoxyribonucleotidase